MNEERLTHLDAEGRARMVDVGAKPASERRASARARLRMSPETARAVAAGEGPKGEVLGVARLAGIQAAKQTAMLIPLAHPIPLSFVDVEASVTGGGPNAFGTVHMRDTSGVLLLAVMALPPAWKQDFGALVSTRPGDAYDEARYRARVTAPDGSTTELGNGWRRVTLAGQTYLGTGSAAKRTLHGDAPPDYVGSWIDVALVRER